MDISTKLGAVLSFGGILISKVAAIVQVDPNLLFPDWALNWLTGLCLTLGSCAAGISLYEWLRAIGKDKKWEKRDDDKYDKNRNL